MAALQQQAQAFKKKLASQPVLVSSRPVPAPVAAKPTRKCLLRKNTGTYTTKPPNLLLKRQQQ